MMTGERERKILKFFVEYLKSVFGERLISVIIYGSFLGQHYRSGISDINLVVVISEITVTDLFSIKKKVIRLASRYRLRPYFFTPDFIRTSTDSFPIEWQDIKESHQIIYGKDVLADIKIDPGDLRRQLEREIKQGYLDFKQGLLFGKNPVNLVEESLKSCRVWEKYFPAIGLKTTQKPPSLPSHGKGVNIKNLCADHLNFLKNLVALIDTGPAKGEACREK